MARFSSVPCSERCCNSLPILPPPLPSARLETSVLYLQLNGVNMSCTDITREQVGRCCFTHKASLGYKLVSDGHWFVILILFYRAQLASSDTGPRKRMNSGNPYLLLTQQDGMSDGERSAPQLLS